MPDTGVKGTVHDLATVHNGMDYQANPADPQKRICVYCHAAHNTYKLSTAPALAGGDPAPVEFDYLPLWNHTLQTNLAYQMYENGTGGPQSGQHASQAILNGGMAPGSTSLLCLSCHDGTVAANSWGNILYQNTESRGSDLVAPSYLIGQAQYLGNHHPIGFVYEDVITAGDVDIRPVTTKMTKTTTIEDHLYNGKLECGSCHSVHNKGNSGEMLLWRSDQASELCITCHDKSLYTAP